MSKKKKSSKKTLTDQIAEEVAKQMPKVDVGVAVAVPSTVKEKMEAVVHLSKAISDLARTLNTTNLRVDVRDCTFNNTNRGLFVGSED